MTCSWQLENSQPRSFHISISSITIKHIPKFPHHSTNTWCIANRWLSSMYIHSNVSISDCTHHPDARIDILYTILITKQLTSSRKRQKIAIHIQWTREDAREVISPLLRWRRSVVLFHAILLATRYPLLVLVHGVIRVGFGVLQAFYMFTLFNPLHGVHCPLCLHCVITLMW